MSKQRTCRTCRKTFPLNRTYFHKSGKGRYRNECKDCTNERNRIRREMERKGEDYNPLEHRAKLINSRHKKLNIEEEVSAEILEELLEFTNNCCFYCNRPLDDLDNIHFDHIVPAKDKEFGVVVPTCVNCNMSKGADTMIDFFSKEYQRQVNADFSKEGYIDTLGKVTYIYNNIYKKT